MDVVAAAQSADGRHRASTCSATSSRSSCRTIGRGRFKSIARAGGPAFRRIAIGDPAAVPAGVYAKAYLEQEGLWTAIEPQVVPCAQRARGAGRGRDRAPPTRRSSIAPTPASRSRRPSPTWSRRSRSPHRLSRCDHARARRPSDESKRFLDFLRGATAARIFERFGFTLAASRAALTPHGDLADHLVHGGLCRRRNRDRAAAGRRPRVAAGAAAVSRAGRSSRRSCRCRS